MRTGAIFARGSCRALKWMALVGVVFALGAAQAAAQETLTVSTSRTVPEGANRVPVSVRLQAPAAAADRSQTVTVTLTLTPRPDDVDDRGKEAELANDDATGTDASWAAGETGQTVDASAGTVAISFSVVGNDVYDRTERAYLNIGTDADAEPEELVITSTSTSSETVEADAITPSGKDVKVTIDDAQTQTYTLAPTNFGTNSTIKEGGQISLTLTASPAKTVDTSYRIELHSEDDSDYGLGASNSESEDIEIEGTVDDGDGATGDGTGTVTLYADDNDEDRADDIVTLTTEHTGDSDDRGKQAADPIEITVTDIHKLPKISREEDIEVEDAEGNKRDETTMLNEGDTGTVTLVVDRTGDGVQVSEDIKIELDLGTGSTATRQDYRLNPDEVTVTGSGKSGTFKLEALTDEDVSPNGEVVVLMATVTGDEDYGDEPTIVLLDAITINDETAKKIFPRTADEVHAAIDEARMEGAGGNGLWNPGETMTLMASDLFDWPDTTTSVVLGNSFSEDQQIATAATSNDSLVITAVSGGTTEISVTATVFSEVSSFQATQTVSNSATVKFPIMVDAHAITAMPQADVDAAVTAAIIEEGGDRWWALDDGMVMVPVEKLFSVPDGLSPHYLAESSDDDVVMAGISGDDMYVNLTHVSTGEATIMVTAVDTDAGATASISFDITVYASIGVVAKSQAEVDEVFEAAGADGLVAQGPAISVDMSELFDVAEDEGWSARYSAETSDADVLMTSASGTSLTLTPGSDPAGGMATITVAVTGTHEQRGRGVYVREVMYAATVDELAAEPTNLVTAKSSEEIEAVLVEAGLGDDAMFHAGSTRMVDATMLFDAAEGVNVSYAAESDDMAVASPSASGSMVTVTAGAAGHAHITITATATMASGIEIHTGQPATNVATVVFSVNIVLSDLMLTLSGPDDMNLVEGGMGGMVTVTASRAVTEDLMVTIMRDRAASSASDDDYMLDPEMITIMAGETMGSTMVMAVEDDMMENVDNMPEELVLYAMAGDMQVEGEVKLYIWDAAVPALPVIAQLLLAAFLAVGGYRRYRQR